MADSFFRRHRYALLFTLGVVLFGFGIWVPQPWLFVPATLCVLLGVVGRPLEARFPGGRVTWQAYEWQKRTLDDVVREATEQMTAEEKEGLYNKAGGGVGATGGLSPLANGPLPPYAFAKAVVALVRKRYALPAPDVTPEPTESEERWLDTP